MAEVKWIKITTDMFDNRKIKHLRRLPDGNNIVLIWVMLLTMAGRCNAGGMIFLTENIPYTPKMLADELDFEESTVQLALEALQRFNMVVMDAGCLRVAGWEEYQNIEGMDKIREQNRLRKRRQREKARLLPPEEDCPVTVTGSHATDIDIEEDIEIEEEKEDISTPPPPKAKKPVKHKHGEYANVLLTDEELDKLKAEYSDWQERIERLSSYIASTGKSYKSHYATIRNWARKDAEKGVKAHGTAGKSADKITDRVGTWL
jgi:predicted phage replisome organizer